jgi:hypothetical protein
MARVSMLVRLQPGVSYPPHRHAGREELHLLHGELWIDDRKLYPGDYYDAEPGTADSRVWSETGCTCVLITSLNDKLGWADVEQLALPTSARLPSYQSTLEQLALLASLAQLICDKKASDLRKGYASLSSALPLSGELVIGSDESVGAWIVWAVHGRAS